MELPAGLMLDRKLTNVADTCYVILHIGTGPSSIEEQQRASRLVVTSQSSRFELSDDVWIERLNEELAKHVQKACEPSHYNVRTIEQDRHLYAFVKRASSAEQRTYEGAEELFALLALSRAIHPTSVGDRYCAKVFQFDRKDSAIQAIQYRGISPDVFLSSKHRDWLSVQDGEELRKLMPWVSKDKAMHRRVHRAYWNHEYAMRSFYLDVRWMSVVSGLEALINVGKDDPKWQFRERVQRLATKFKVTLTDKELCDAYDLRSKLVHAESFLHGLGNILPQSEHNPLYEKLESMLRMTVKHCLLDESFGDCFRDDAAVSAAFPLSPKPMKRTNRKK